MALLSVDKFRSYLETQFINFANRIASVFSRKDQTAYSLDLELNQETFTLSISLKDIYGKVLDTKEKDLPIESMIIGIEVNKETNEIILKYKGGESVPIAVKDLFSGVLPDTATIAGLNVKDNPTAQQLQVAMQLATVATTGSYNDLANKPSLNYLPLTGGTLSGNLSVLQAAITNTNGKQYNPGVVQAGNKASIKSDDEGGNIHIESPTGVEYEMDAFGGKDLRLYHNDPVYGYGLKTIFGYSLDKGTFTVGPIERGGTTKIVKKSNGVTVTETTTTPVAGTLVTDVTKTNDTTTTISETYAIDGKTRYTNTFTIVRDASGNYSVNGNNLDISAWGQAAWIVAELGG